LKNYVGVSSVSLMLTTQKELNLLKMIIYPRALEVTLKMLKEKGYIRDFKHSEIIGYWLVAIATVYNWGYEP